MARKTPRKTPYMKRIEEKFGKPIDVLLRNLYHGESMTLEAIGEQLDLDHSTVSRWMDRFGIPTKEWVLPPASGDA